MLFDRFPRSESIIKRPVAQRPISLRPYYALLGAAFIAPMLLFAGVAWRYRLDTLANAVTEVQRTVELTAQQAHDLLQIHHLLAQRVNEHIRGMTWEEIQHSTELHDYLNELVNQYPQGSAIFLADASCTLLASSRVFPQTPVSCADRDYYKVLQSGREVALGGISVGRIGGQLNFNFAMRRSGGPAGGIIIISATQDYFVNFWRTLVPGRAIFGLYSEDGRILARLPPTDLAHTMTDPKSEFMRAVAKADHGSLEAISTIDGIDRILAFQHIADFNLFVAHGIARATVLDAWREQVMLMGAFFGAAAVALTALALLALRRAHQERYYAETLETRVRERTTELTRIARQLAQSQKMEAIGNLTGGIAHDFNNLLNLIIGNLDLLCESTHGSDADELLQDVLKAALRGRDLIKRLLAFGRRQILNPRLVDLTMLITNLFRVLERTLGGIKLSLTFSEGLWLVEVDSSQLEDALTNLATNARDAMPEGGQIEVVTYNQHVTDRMDIRLGDYVVIEVRDTGRGMEPEVMEHIFEPFFTTKQLHQGTGLGLSMVFGFMKQSGGTIVVNSELNLGTTFRLYLPRVDV